MTKGSFFKTKSTKNRCDLFSKASRESDRICRTSPFFLGIWRRQIPCPAKVTLSCVFLRSCFPGPCGISHQHQVALLLGRSSSLYDRFENVSCMYLAYYISVFKCLYRRWVGVVYLAMYKSVGVQGQRSISVVFLYHPLRYFLKQFLSLNLELS